jgi:hypothetical protein
MRISGSQFWFIHYTFELMALAAVGKFEEFQILVFSQTSSWTPYEEAQIDDE